MSGKSGVSSGSSSATRGAWPSALAKLSAETRPASRLEAKSLSVKLLICWRTDAPTTGSARRPTAPSPGCVRTGRVPDSRRRRQNCGSCSSTWSVAPTTTPQPAASIPIEPRPMMTPTMIPRLNATPTAAGPAKRPWIWSIAVKMAEKPCSARAGAMIRMSSAVWASREGSSWKRAAKASGQIATTVERTIRKAPVHTARALTSRHALSVPRSARSRWNTGMISVTSV